MKKYILAVATTLGLMATPLFAQQSDTPRKAEPKPSVEQIAERRTDRAVRLLELTDAQRKQIYEINLKELRECAPLIEQMQAIRANAADEMKAVLSTEQFMAWSQMQRPRHEAGPKRECAGRGECPAPGNAGKEKRAGKAKRR